jgi:hypothetical protein
MASLLSPKAALDIATQNQYKHQHQLQYQSNQKTSMSKSMHKKSELLVVVKIRSLKFYLRKRFSLTIIYALFILISMVF